MYLDIKAQADLEQLELDDEDIQERKKKPTNAPQVADGVQIDLNKIVVIEATPEDKEAEEAERQGKIEKLEHRVQKLELRVQDEKKERAERMKAQIAEMREQIQLLDEERMTEQKLWGYNYDANDDDQGNTFGRKVLKEGTMEQQLRLPFRTYPLFINPQGWQGGPANHIK